MNRASAKDGKSKEKKVEYVKLESFSVDRVKVFEGEGDRPDSVIADITLNGIKIYGVKVVEVKNGDFLSFPARKGSDGKYYSIAYAALSKEDQTDIIAEIEKQC